MTQEHIAPPVSSEAKNTDTDRALTIRIPKLSAMSAQSILLTLLIAFSLIQTVELFAVRSASSAIKIAPATSGTSVAPASDGSLPEMVGGC